MCINHVSVKQCQECQEQEKRNQEANEELAKKDQIIKMLKEEVDKKEKMLTAMKGGEKKERTEMKKKERKEKEMTMKEELGKKEKELTVIKEEMKKEMTAMNKEMEEKEKEITAMKEEMEKKDVEMTTVKKELQLTENMLELAYFLESETKCIMNQKDKVIEKNNLLINKLNDEIQRLSNQTLCGICYDKKIQVVFLPCRHFFCCHPCASSLPNCPICKAGIRDTVAVFWG